MEPSGKTRSSASRAPTNGGPSSWHKVLNVRHVPFHNLYDTLADVVVVAEPALQLGPGRAEINAGYFAPTMTVMDLSAMPGDTPCWRKPVCAAAKWWSQPTFTIC